MRYKIRKSKPARRGRFKVRTRVGAICLLSTTFLIPISPVSGGMAEGLVAYRAGDYVTAHAEWLPLARDGAAAAQRNVGQLYRLGQGVPRDAAVAANWYRLAAEQGLARAQSNLAAMYLQGDGVEKNAGVAAEWMRRAAAQGHTRSQFNLGLLYETGVGVGMSLEKARSWYELAAGAGNASARERLANLRNAPAKDDVALLPPARETATPNAGAANTDMPEAGTRGLIMPPANPDAAREAELTRVRISIAQVLRERAALATRNGKTDLPPPPFARGFAHAEEPPADAAPRETAPKEIARTENSATDASQSAAVTSRAASPLPDFLRREAESDTGVPRFKPLPGFLVAEAQRDKPLPAFLGHEAKHNTGALKFKPLPQFLVEEAEKSVQEIIVAAAPDAAPAIEEESLPPLAAAPGRQPKPLPDFPRQEARDGADAPRIKLLPRFLVAEAQPNEPAPEIPRRASNGEKSALTFKPLPPFLAEKAQRDDREINVASASATTAPASHVEQEALPPFPQPRPWKPIPDFLKREAREPVSLVVAAARASARKPVPPAPRIAGVDSLSLPLPSFLRREAEDDRARRLALNVGPDGEPFLYTPQAAPAEPESAPGSNLPPAPDFLMLEAARDRATALAAESLALAAQGPAPETFKPDSDTERATRFAFEEKPEPQGSPTEVSSNATTRTIKVEPVPEFLIREARETRRSLVVAIARSLAEVLRPARNARVPEIIPPTVVKPIPEFLKREATESRRRTVAELADAGVETRKPRAYARDDGASEPPIPEFLRREAGEDAQVAAVSKSASEFMKIESLLDGAEFGGFKPVPALIRREAAAQPLVLASGSAAPVPEFIRYEAKLDQGGRTFVLRRGPKGPTIVRTTPKTQGLADAGSQVAGAGTAPVPEYIKLEAALEARFTNASPPPPIRVRAPLPTWPEARTLPSHRDERPTEPRSAVVLVAAARETEGAPLWLGEPEHRPALSRRVVDAGVTAYGANDFTRAHDLWLAVARRGDADAQFLVGGLYADGTGAPQDLGRAYQWWRLSGEQGHTRAQELLPTLLGLMDEEEAVLAEAPVQTT